ncbi:hypothetical protein ACFYW9_22620 [Streptomyces sp. NPDC002698]|uniref:hypothetical protein n=1 Tax=Streptomyces sp. NPDC002698 TaxID=3364660 RepID=UPI0036D12A71
MDLAVGRGESTDAARGRIVPLLPGIDGRGRPWRDHRQVVNGVLWRLRTGESSRAIRVGLRRRGIRAVIPERADQVADRKRRGPAGGRPSAFDADQYKARNVVERCFSGLKQFRAIATRFDELADRYRAGLHLAALILCLREPAR